MGTTKVGKGLSHHRDPRVAAQEAVAQALAEGDIDQPSFVFMFATVGYDQPTIVKAVREATHGAPLTGCSAEGVIVQATPDESNFALAVLAIRSDEIRFQNGLATGMQANPLDAGRAIGRTIEPQDARVLFLFPDGVTVDFDSLREGIEGTLALDQALPIVGGTAGDNWKWVQTYQYCDDQVVSDGVAWAVLSGDVRLVTAVNHGCVGLGVKHAVTRSEGGRIFELDGRPAFDVVREYMAVEELDDWAVAMVSLPLGLDVANELAGYDDDNYIMRVITSMDKETGSVTIPTQIRPGASITMHRRDYQKTIDGVNRLADELASQFAGEVPKFVLQFECCGRGKNFLRDEQKLQVLQQLRERLPAAPWFGFYSFGEIGPVAGRNWFHNYSSVIAAFV
jgi:hypothetical protein